MIQIIWAEQSHVSEIIDMWLEHNKDSDRHSEVTHCVENYPGFVALDTDSSAIVGVSYTFEISKDLLLLHGLMVSDNYRNQKLGSALLDRTQFEAKKLGYTILMTTNSMKYEGLNKRSAVPFYLQHGFIEVFSTPGDTPTHTLTKVL